MEIPVEVAAGVDDYVPSFVRDVNPVLSPGGLQRRHLPRRGQGQERLQALAPRLRSALRSSRADRRPGRAADQHGLARRQPDAAQADGRRAAPGRAACSRPTTPYYRIAAPLDRRRAPSSICRPPAWRRSRFFPQDPVIDAIGDAQQMRVVATYADATTRDVTREAFIESGNTEVATADRQGVLTAVRRGEAPVLARYEGAYAATTLTVMGDRSGFVWQPPETWGRIDELVAAKWQRMKILPSGLCTDAEFLRRVYLDLTGLPPTADDVRAFLGRPARHPREARRADRPADRQRRLRRALDEQVGRPAAGQPQVPRAGRGRRLPEVDPRPGGGQHALRRVRREDPHRHRIEPREPARLVLQDPPRADRHDGEHHAPLPGRAVQLQQVPRPSVRALDPGPVLPDGRLLRPRRAEGRPGLRRSQDRRHERRERQAALRDRRRQAAGRGHARSDEGRRRAEVPLCRRLSASRQRHAPPGVGRLAHLAGRTPISPRATSTGSGATCSARHHRAARRHPRRQPAHQPGTARLPDARVHRPAVSTCGTCCG